MNRLPVEFLEQGFHRVLFDAMPLPIFVVDDDVCIFDYNAAAARLLGKGKRLIVRHRAARPAAIRIERKNLCVTPIFICFDHFITLELLRDKLFNLYHKQAFP